MKKIVFAAALLLVALLAKVESQSTASYGSLVTSLTTTSAGAVTGTSFGVPQGSASIITWSVVADGSAISTTLEGSLDNTTWFTVDTITTPATGAVKNYGFTSLKFIRISQVSRTGGTTTTGTIVTSRAFPASTAVSGSGNTFLAGDGTALLPSYAFSSEPTLGLWRSASGLIQVQGNLIATGSISAGTTSEFTWGQTRSRLRSPADGVIQLSNLAVTDFGRLQFGGTTSSFPALARSSAELQVRLADDSNYTNIRAMNFISSGITFAALGTPANGFLVYCSDCTIASPCAGSGTGALAKRLNNIWVCN